MIEFHQSTAAERYDRALHLSLMRHPVPAGCPVPQPTVAWPTDNVALLEAYRTWLVESGAARSTIEQHRIPVAGYVLGLSLKPYSQLDLSAHALEASDGDLGQVLAYLQARGKSQIWLKNCRHSLTWFRRFLRLKQGLVVDPKEQVSDECPAHYRPGLPDWLREQMKQYLHLRQANWQPMRLRTATRQFWHKHTRLWRWLFVEEAVIEISDIRRQHLFRYMDEMLAQGYAPSSVNQDLYAFQAMLRFLQERGWSVPQALLNVSGLKTPDSLPRFLTDEQVIRLQVDLEERVEQAHTQAQQRDALLDRAAFYLLWQAGLRVGELEALTLSDLNLAHKQIIIRQGKGMKDRTIYLTQTAVAALGAYQAVRGPANSDHLFLYRFRPLNRDLVRDRLKAAGQRAGVKVTPHMLRHTFATQLVNAGCQATTIQALLGHRRLNSTMVYARVHDQTVMDDYFSAMTLIEERLEQYLNLPKTVAQSEANNPSSEVNQQTTQLLALVIALQTEPLTDRQQDIVMKLQQGLETLTSHSTSEAAQLLPNKQIVNEQLVLYHELMLPP